MGNNAPGGQQSHAINQASWWVTSQVKILAYHFRLFRHINPYTTKHILLLPCLAVQPCIRVSLLSPAHEVGRGILSSPYLAVRLCVYVSFLDDISGSVCWIFFLCAHTHPLGWCNRAFWRLWLLIWFFTFDFVAVIDFNWWGTISSFSGRYPRKAFAGLFSYCTHTSFFLGDHITVIGNEMDV